MTEENFAISSSPRRRGSSTPRLIGSITAASGILDHPPARVMTAEYEVAISRRHTSEVCYQLPPSCSEGAGKTGCLLHPRSRVRFCANKKVHTSIQGSGSIPAFPAQWLYGLLRALPGEWLFCLRYPKEASLLQNVMPAPRHQNHTTSPYVSGTHVCCAFHVHRICPRV